jgi:hypothetical protein
MQKQNFATCYDLAALFPSHIDINIFRGSLECSALWGRQSAGILQYRGFNPLTSQRVNTTPTNHNINKYLLPMQDPFPISPRRYQHRYLGIPPEIAVVATGKRGMGKGPRQQMTLPEPAVQCRAEPACKLPACVCVSLSDCQRAQGTGKASRSHSRGLSEGNLLSSQQI